MQLVIVTGMSGAGKSRVIDSLEDIGFFCVDNMTPKLIPTFVQLLNDSAEIRATRWFFFKPFFCS